MKILANIAGIGFIALLAACNGDGLSGIDASKLTALPAIDSIKFSSISPDAAHDYWELRASFYPQDRVVGSGGPSTRAQLAASVRTTLDTLRATAGFRPSCLPGYCYNYAVVVKGQTVTKLTTLTDFQAFLGGIQTAEEAALLVHALGYYWLPGGNGTGIRANGDGWDVVALIMVKDCAPVQTDRVLMHVHGNGLFDVRDRKVYSKNENACV